VVVVGTIDPHETLALEHHGGADRIQPLEIGEAHVVDDRDEMHQLTLGFGEGAQALADQIDQSR
jgi:hypothetical protein